jgi:Rrf2 family protein
MSQLISISQAVSLGMHGLAVIAKEYPKRVSAKQLANRLDASEAHLAKIFQRIAKSGMIKSFRGPAGGFILNRNPEEISFLDIYEVIETKIILNHCPLDKDNCVFDNCIFDGELNRISQDIYDTFKKLKLSQYVEETK